jgi:hypothetical protein
MQTSAAKQENKRSDTDAISGHSQDNSAEQVAARADFIYKFAAKAKLEGMPDDVLLSGLQRDHREMFLSYPTVMALAIDSGLYFPKIFRRWQEDIKRRPWTTEDSKMESWADYYLMTLRHAARNSKGKNNKSPSEWTAIRQDYVRMLKENHKKFYDNCKKVEADVNAEDAKMVDDRRADIAVRVKALGQARIKAAAATLSDNTSTPPTSAICNACGCDLTVVSESNRATGRYVYTRPDTKADAQLDAISIGPHAYCDACFMVAPMLAPPESYSLIKN